MLVRNKLVKALGYLLIWLVSLFEAFLLAMLTVSIIMSLVCCVWSFITPLPAYVASRYGLLMILGAVPFTIGYFVYVMIKTTK